jgi:hypothetical protein
VLLCRKTLPQSRVPRHGQSAGEVPHEISPLAAEIGLLPIRTISRELMSRHGIGIRVPGINHPRCLGDKLVFDGVSIKMIKKGLDTYSSNTGPQSLATHTHGPEWHQLCKDI